jgi:N6-L-threonylcarbamoyladenine synthase
VKLDLPRICLTIKMLRLCSGVRVASHIAATRRPLVTLAIESSCDDSAVAVIETRPSGALTVHFHEKVTANNDGYGGIHPLVALQSHQNHIAPLVQQALSTSPKPDLVAATRGPGMRSNLAVGLDIAKGLSLGLNVPLMGVHHMQAHALTPRLVNALENERNGIAPLPDFPFLTVLASGGHTMLVDSTNLVEHHILAETQDIALGECLDKAARSIIPAELLRAPYGRALEDFAFPNGKEDYQYAAPARRREELARRMTRWKWGLGELFFSKCG